MTESVTPPRSRSSEVSPSAVTQSQLDHATRAAIEMAPLKDAELKKVHVTFSDVLSALKGKGKDLSYGAARVAIGHFIKDAKLQKDAAIAIGIMEKSKQGNSNKDISIQVQLLAFQLMAVSNKLDCVINESVAKCAKLTPASTTPAPMKGFIGPGIKQPSSRAGLHSKRKSKRKSNH